MPSLARGCIYHGLAEDAGNILRATFGRLDDTVAVADFEAAFGRHIGRRHCIAFPFARSAVYHILKNLGLPAGSEVIMPPITIKPMVDVVLQAGFKPVFVDIERETLCYDIEDLDRCITERTRVIMITYLFGEVPDMERLITWCRAKNLFILEDMSHNLNAAYKGQKLGTFGDIAVYSTSSMKTVDTYGGGLVLTDDDDTAGKLRSVCSALQPTPRGILRVKIILNLARNLFSRKIPFSLFTVHVMRILKSIAPVLLQKLMGARLGLVPTREFLPEWGQRFTGLQAATGLRHLRTVEEIDRKRIANVNRYRGLLDTDSRIGMPVERDDAYNVYWQFPVFVDDFDAYRTHMLKAGLDTGTTNLSLCSQLEIYPDLVRDTPNAVYIKYHAAFLPIYPALTDRDVRYVADTVKSFFAREDAS